MWNKILLSMIVGLTILVTSFVHAIKKEQYDVAISLGEVCQTATFLRRSGLRNQSFPLDWNVVPFEALIRFIECEGGNFLHPDNLLFNRTANPDYPSTGVLDCFYGICAVHDFIYTVKPECVHFPNSTFSDIESINYDEVIEKYRRRIERFFRYLRSPSSVRVLLCRLGINRRQAIELRNVLVNKFPQLNFTLLAIDGHEEMKKNWKLSRIINVYLPRQDMWNSYPRDWDKLFSHFEVKLDPALETVDAHHY